MSTEDDSSPAARLHSAAQRPARLIHTICQMILGAGLAVALILKVYMAILTDHTCAADAVTLGNTIRCTSTLVLLAYVLGLSAGFELAYRLFDDHLARVMAPVLLGLAAGALGVVDGILNNGAGWRDALLIVSLIACIGGMLWLRRALTPGSPDG